MPITIRTEEINVKNTDGTFMTIDAVTDKTTSQRIAEAETAIENKKSEVMTDLDVLDPIDVGNVIADNFDASKNYSAGDYFLDNNNGTLKMYQFKADHSAGTWNASEVNEVKVGEELKRIEAASEEEVASLKSVSHSIKSIMDSETTVTWAIGGISIDTGVTNSNNKRIHFDAFLPVTSDTIICVEKGAEYSIRFYTAADKDTYVIHPQGARWHKFDKSVSEAAKDAAVELKYFRLTVRKADDSEVTDVNALSAKIHIITLPKIHNLEDSISNTKDNAFYLANTLERTLEYVIGSINGGSGQIDNTSTNRVRSLGYIPITDIAYINVEDGYKYNIRCYSGTESTTYVGTWSSFMTDTMDANAIQLKYPTANYVRILGAYIDDSDISIATNVSSKIHIYNYNTVFINEMLHPEDSVDLKWEVGIMSIDGDYTANTTRARAIYPIQIAEGLKISSKNASVEFSWRLIDDNFEMVAGQTYSWENEAEISAIYDSIYLVARFTDDRTITSDNIQTIVNAVTVIRKGIPKSLPKFALGGVTVNNIKNLIQEKSTPYMSLVAVRYKNRTNDIPITDGYLFRTNESPFKFYFSAGTPDSPEYVFDWDETITDRDPIDYSCLITYEGDILFVFKGDREAAIKGISRASASTVVDQSRLRKNPIIYPHGNYENPKVIEFDSGEAPTAWLMNDGYYVQNGKIFVTEYTRPAFYECYLWEAVAPYDDSENWTIRKTFDVGYPMDANGDTDTTGTWNAQTGFKHIHNVDCDPFTGIMYLTTGDQNNAAAMFYSTDDGETWIPLIVGERKFARQINYIWLKDKVYWATDDGTPSVHCLFGAERNDETGIIDTNSLQELYHWHTTDATYHLCYVREPEGLVPLGRYDSSKNSPIDLLFYDLKVGKMRHIGRFEQVNPPQMAGFRTDVTTEWPNAIDSRIVSGFSCWANLLKVLENVGTVSSDLTSDPMMVKNDDSNITKVNNFWIEIM